MFRASSWFIFSPLRRLLVKKLGWAVLVFIFSPRRRCLVTRSAARSLLVQKPGWAVFAQWTTATARRRQQRGAAVLMMLSGSETRWTAQVLLTIPVRGRG